MIDIMKFREPIVENALFDPITMDRREREAYAEPSPFALFPILAYVKGGEKIGNSIRFDYDFGVLAYILGVAIPEDGERIHPASLVLDGISKFKGEKDIALAIPQYDGSGKPAFEILEDPKNKYMATVHILNEDAVYPIERFPREDGFYLTEPRFKLPHGDELPWDTPDARCLIRCEGSYVGLTIRGSMLPDAWLDWPHVVACKTPSSRLGVLLYGEQPNTAKPAA
ncbi:MAG: hypothetical protein Q7T16_05485 [Candidatus Burarchaeum sp.]|nr:hypothetical protein [Candidatus Burarchaeum sp.]MDO8340078.1 hypothetical protein [Candidatus Burarchaeum sp.]